jgi:hypothetical protein
MDLEIEVDDETAPDYDIASNFAENLVDAIRSDMVGNEGPFLALNAVYATGLFENPSHYLATIVRGKSGEGKTELKQNTDSLWPNHWLFRTTATSDKGLIDEDEWNQRYVAALSEFQQMPKTMLEMMKASAGDDADEDGVGFSYTRNVDDGDGGRDTDEIKKQSMPFVFLFADENSAEVDWELATRMMTVRVESDEDINEAVIESMFDHEKVEVTDREHEYIFNFEDGKSAIRNHIANVPRPLEYTIPSDDGSVTREAARPVVIPHDESIEWPINDHPSIDSAGWDVAKVLKPIFNPGKSDSKRAAKAVANHVRAWALMNHHNREVMEINGTEHIVAEPQDVANVLAYRDLLLNLTHDINEKKFAVIDALTDEHNGVGAPGPNGGLQAPHKDIREYIDEYASITSLTKSQLTNSRDQGILDQMEEDYLIEVHEGEGENGAHLYEFLGGSTFGHPNIDLYPDLFEHCTDPINKQPITQTVKDFERSLSMTTTEDLMSDDPMDALGTANGGDDGDADDSSEAESDDLSAFTDEDDTEDVEWNEVDEAVHERLQETMDDKRATPQDVASLDLTHMLGVSPVELYTDDRGMPYITAERGADMDDRKGTVFDSSHHLWGDKSDGQVYDTIKNSVAKLRQHEVFEVMEDEPDNAENDDKYLLVRDLDDA